MISSLILASLLIAQSPSEKTQVETAPNPGETEKNGEWTLRRPEFKQGPVKLTFLRNKQRWAEAAEVLEGDLKGKYVPYHIYEPEPVQIAYGDPYGFLAWLNGIRGQYGRGAVGYDANLSGWAAVNNGQQHAFGMGHHVMGYARRQNAGMGAAQTVWPMWMASPAHQDALLDPTISMIGIAASGAYWTFNAY
jgi:hypothetical protein